MTKVDRESEQALVKAIHAARPNDAIQGEEGTSVSGNSGVRWIIDPLDGTTNFVHRYPFHSVAVGVEVDGKTAVGVVHDTFRDQVYAGVVGYTATRDDNPISIFPNPFLIVANPQLTSALIRLFVHTKAVDPIN